MSTVGALKTRFLKRYSRGAFAEVDHLENLVAAEYDISPTLARAWVQTAQRQQREYDAWQARLRAREG
jgi:hypothetical protein